MVVLHFYDFAISISIHAPTRGATTVYQGRAILVRFQSTLPQEERLFPNLCVLVYVNFNPRSHKRSDLPALRPPAPFRDFNPRSHKRSDMNVLRLLVILEQFQSTLPQEERLGDCCWTYGHINFNPRSHKRSDRMYFSALCSLPYFNPRSHKRSDSDDANQFRICKISIHAPTRGATLSVVPVQTGTQISIHAPTRGATARSCTGSGG